jgi:hypothetical protein
VLNTGVLLSGVHVAFAVPAVAVPVVSSLLIGLDDLAAGVGELRAE